MKIELESKINIHYKLEGSKKNPLLLLSHGFGSDSTSYDNLVPYLLDDFYILRWDHRGHGESDKPKGKNYKETMKLYTLEQLASDIYDLLKKLNLLSFEDIFLYGHSMGGMISQVFTLNYQNILKKLALGSTAPCNNDPKLIQVLNEYKKIGMNIDIELLKQNVRFGYTEHYLKEHPEVFEESIQRKKRVGPEILLALMENFVLHFDIRNKLKKIKIPTLILHGDGDQTINIKWAEVIHELIPNSQFVRFPNMSHGINVEIPEKVAELLKNFFLYSFH